MTITSVSSTDRRELRGRGLPSSSGDVRGKVDPDTERVMSRCVDRLTRGHTSTLSSGGPSNHLTVTTVSRVGSHMRPYTRRHKGVDTDSGTTTSVGGREPGHPASGGHISSKVSVSQPFRHTGGLGPSERPTPDSEPVTVTLAGVTTTHIVRVRDPICPGTRGGDPVTVSAGATGGRGTSLDGTRDLGPVSGRVSRPSSSEGVLGRGVNEREGAMTVDTTSRRRGPGCTSTSSSWTRVVTSGVGPDSVSRSGGYTDPHSGGHRPALFT